MSGGGATFRVWAPRAGRVEVAIAGRRDRVPMRASTPDGWFEATVPGTGPGTDHAFVLDGREPALPDPRSRFQPAGVHGPSRLVDVGAFPWTDAGFQAPPLSSALVYELHVGTFSPEGTFAGVARRLDPLVALGVTHVELMPVAEFPGTRGWGYDGVDLFAPHHAYGGPAELARLVDACHARGLAVLLDVVYNHLGPAGNYLERFGPYFTDAVKTPWGPAVNLDGPWSHEVRRFFCDNALQWLRDYHVDGLRLDAVHAFSDSSALPFLEQLGAEVRALAAATGRHLVVIAESDLNDPRLVRAVEAGGFGLDAQWSDDFHHALHTVLTGERAGYYEDFGSLAALAKALENAYVYDGGFSAHRRRPHGRPPHGLSGHRFLGYLQNHDQVGNRAQGDRASALLDLGKQKVGAALVLTAPFVPLLFMGEEWGARTPFQYFTDHEDPELGRAVSEGRRREFEAFGWEPSAVPDPQARETFERSRLDWSELERAPHREVLAWYRDLVRLRRAVPALADGRLAGVRVDFDEGARWIRVERGPVTVVANLGEASARVPVGGDRARRVLLASHEITADGEGAGGAAVTLPPASVVILG